MSFNVSDNDYYREENGNNSRESDSRSRQNVENDLTHFREQWQKELAPKRNSPCKSSSSKAVDSETNIEEQAKQLFSKGADYEYSGSMYEAIQCYKKAVQLVPDIEFRLYNSVKNKNLRSDIEETSDVLKKFNLNDSIEVGDEDVEDLLLRIEKTMSENNCLCGKEYENEATHISMLPMEIILFILRWVVSTELDLRSLENFGTTCRGFYLCSRDSEIWKLACARVWGIHCGSPSEHAYGSWRDMFISRPRLKFDGCYISRTTYVRHGENSFQDQFYRPWHLVEYYRCVRFFPDGLVLMVTSSEAPSFLVSQLKWRTPKHNNILVGRYRQHDDFVTLLVQKPEQEVKDKGYRGRRRRDSMTGDSSTRVFQLDLQIVSYKKKRNNQLNFVEYTVVTKYRNGSQVRSNFDLGSTKFPPLRFSRVKSYGVESEQPLE